MRLNTLSTNFGKAHSNAINDQNLWLVTFIMNRPYLCRVALSLRILSKYRVNSANKNYNSGFRKKIWNSPAA